MQYSLFGNGAELFAVNPSSGVVTVNYCATPGRGNCLDFESRTSYFLSFLATDGADQSAVVPLTINVLDSNDNDPVFLRETYNFAIDEGSSRFEPSARVQATDLDVTSAINYQIVGGNDEELFAVDQNNGELYVRRPVKSRYNNITLRIQASDDQGISMSSVNIVIRDANDNTPVFEKDRYFASISESARPGTFVEQVIASDADAGLNAQITYKLHRGSFDDFQIDGETGLVTVARRAKIDYDRKNLYDIEIVAIDHGVPPKIGTTLLTVHILNHNNKEPYFTPSSQRAEVNERTEINTIFYRMQAEDPDVGSQDALLFQIENVSGISKDGVQVPDNMRLLIATFFGIEPPTGEVYVASRLNRDVAAIIHLNVSVTDQTAKPIPQIAYGSLIINIIDYNDHPPTFGRPWSPERPELTFSISENQPVGSVLTNLIASDRESKISRYEISPPNEYFAIDPGSGVITVKKLIDFESLATDRADLEELRFNVIVYDSGVPQLSARAIVLVNVLNINDNHPVFNQSSYEATIEENAPWESPVLRVTATDADKGAFGQVTYTLLNNEGNFIIGEKNGEIRVAPGANLDRETGPILVSAFISAVFCISNNKSVFSPINFVHLTARFNKSSARHFAISVLVITFLYLRFGLQAPRASHVTLT